MRHFYLLLFFVICYVEGLFITTAFAEESEFSVAYDTTYTVTADGTTSVNQQITIENLTSAHYIQSYQLTLSSERVTNITASDKLGPLELSINHRDGKTQIKADFNEQVAGKGKKLVWNLRYQNPDATRKTGSIWQIDIPAIVDSMIVSYKLTLLVPIGFGQAAFISPQPTSTIKESGNMLYTFIENKFVSATFGQYQAFDFHFTYHLKNPQFVPIATEIALPPQTNFQDIIIQDISPAPDDVRVDADGNWLARFHLASRAERDVTVAGTVKLYATPRETNIPLSDKLRKLYLGPQQYWETESNLIKEKAKELKTPQNIYNYVTSLLKYNTNRLTAQSIERLGASAVLEKPDQAVCMEFTDLFIALARAAGIPAREINGWAYTGDSKLRPLSLKNAGTDTLHAWPEYWDESQGWIAIDPTWGATTGGADYFHQLDLNHFALAIHGASSSNPLPAGAYKYDSTQQNDVSVSFATNVPDTKAQANLTVEFPDQVYAGLPLYANITVENSGQIIIPHGNLQIQANILRINQKQQDIGPLPPKAKRTVKVNLSAPNWLFGGEDTMTVLLNGEAYHKRIVVKPIFADFLPWLGGLFVAVTLITTGVFAAKRTRRVSL